MSIRRLPLMSCLATLLAGCGSATLTQQKALTEKVTPVLAEMRQRQAEAETARIALFAAAPVINAKVETAELETLIKVLCASPPPVPGDALDAMDAFQKQLAKLSKDPEASFGGYQQSMESSKKTIDTLAATGNYKARASARKAEADKQEKEIVGRGLDCRTVVRQNFAVDLSAPDLGADVKALGSVAVIQALGKLMLKVEEIADRELRAAALRKYVSVYKSEIAVALDQLDSSSSQASGDTDPVLRKTKNPDNARSAYAAMLRAHLQFIERKAVLLMRDAGNPALPRSINLQAAEGLSATTAAHAKILGSLTLADKTLAGLRTWYATYIAAIEAGPTTPSELIDALFAATKDLSALNDSYGAFDKAKDK